MVKNLKKTDPEIFKIIEEEKKRQKEVLELIPSENYTSTAVRETLSSELVNKYSEGYPKKRYYQGNKFADSAEILAIERAKELFHVPHANVQPYSGSPANLAVYFALLEVKKDTILGLDLTFGGHLTHGAKVSIAGSYFKSVSYTLGKDGYLDFAEIEKLALKHKPKIIVCGFTAYPRKVDFEKFEKIAKKVGAYLLADISHIGGLVAAGVHMSPVAYADVVVTTTHKSLRGPRGAIIMVTNKGLKKDKSLAEKIDKAVFPGLQGGPHDNQTAAIAVALKEASNKSFVKYSEQIVKNAKALAEELTKRGFNLASGGTDNHLILIDLRNKNINGAFAAHALEQANIVVNKNGVPFDTNPPFYPSGIRIGTPAITTRGMKERDMKKLADWMDRTIQACGQWGLPGDKKKRIIFFRAFKEEIKNNAEIKKVREEVRIFASKHPLP